MRKTCFSILKGYLLASVFAASLMADEVLPTLSREKMSDYRSAFERAITQSQDRALKPGAQIKPETSRSESFRSNKQSLQDISKNARQNADRMMPPNVRPQGAPERSERFGNGPPPINPDARQGGPRRPGQGGPGPGGGGRFPP